MAGGSSAVYLFEDFNEQLNIPSHFLKRASSCPDKIALRYKIGNEYSGSLTWRDWMERVRRVALGLYRIGIRKGDHVGILSENRFEWTLADLGALSLGAVVVPVYATSSAEDIQYIFRHSGVRALFVSSREQLLKVAGLTDQMIANGLITFEPDDLTRTLSLKDLEKWGHDEELNRDGIYEACLRDVSSDDLATIVYTSGTTGRPKGVMLTHRNFIANCSGSRHYISLGENDVVVSFLPLAHIFERTAGYYFAAICGACIVYAESIRTVARDIAAVCPTVVFAVPRFFEKAQSRVEEKLRQVAPVVRRIYNWALNIGKTATSQTETTGKVSFWIFVAHGIAKSLLLRKIRCAFGGRIRFFVSGGAPLSSDLARFFHAAGLLILEGYGLTETSPVIAVNTLGAFRFGSVGRPIPNIRVRIAQDGEIITSGPCLMRGYYRDPEGTAASMKQGGFYTGDIGCLDSDGFLHVTDRKKDIIVTAGGKNVAPANIENRILSDNFFSQVLVVGDKRPYLCALIVPNRKAIMTLAETLNLSNLSYPELLRHPEIVSQVQKRIDQSLEGFASYERLKSFELLEQEFSLAKGELTPTLKMKRRVICEKYKDCIETLYRKTDLAWAELQEPQAPPACL